MNPLESTWAMDWGWSLPLILVNVLMHVTLLGNPS